MITNNFDDKNPENMAIRIEEIADTARKLSVHNSFVMQSLEGLSKNRSNTVNKKLATFGSPCG